MYLLKNKTPVGARDVQRKLNFSSPTLAVYHLEKLETLGLAKKNPEGYTLTKKVNVGAISQVIKFGSILLPRYILYLTLFTTMLACYFTFAWFIDSLELNIHSSFAILLGLTILAVMVYECIRIWKQKI